MCAGHCQGQVSTVVVAEDDGDVGGLMVVRTGRWGSISVLGSQPDRDC